jgi:hypothetical protein
MPSKQVEDVYNETRSRRISPLAEARQKDPVLTILRQMEILSYREFAHLARILGTDPVLMDEAVEEGIAVIEKGDVA